jgi:carbonic anhydrase/SulP family sulfate permease
MMGLKEHYDELEDRVQYVDYTTREMQSALTPDRVLQLLREGNERYRTGQLLTRDLSRQLGATADTQHPLAIVLSGASSRTPVETVFDMGIGDLYCARVIGNYISRGVLGNLEHACVLAGAKLIVVMGHSNSAACRMVIESHISQQNVAEQAQCGNLVVALDNIRQSLDPASVTQWRVVDDASQQAIMDQLYQHHIHRTIRLIRERSPILDTFVNQGKVKIVGAMYNVRTGMVNFFD